MRAVVTGGAGFIGSHLIEALLAAGHEVVCIERPGAPAGWIAGLPVNMLPIGLADVRQLADAFRGAEVVFHLAALTQARRAAEYYAVNTDGTARVMEASARLGGHAPRVVLASSLAALGPCTNGELLSAHSPPHPLTCYGRSKLLAERAVRAYAGRVPATILRLATVYGPRERAVLTFFRLVQRGVALTIGGWDRSVSMLYVKDLVQGILAAAGSDRAVGGTYCLAHPRPVTWALFARACGRALGRRPVMVSVPAPAARVVAILAETCAALRGRAAVLNRERVREMAQPRWVCDVRPAILEFGFRPRFPAPRGIAETAAWYREARWL